jgi:hypothetical protein
LLRRLRMRWTRHRWRSARGKHVSTARISPAAPPVRGSTHGKVPLAVPLRVEGEVAPARRATPSSPLRSWLEAVAFFVPKSIREPFLGDLREDMGAMTAQGYSPMAVRWAALSQMVALVLRLICRR